MNIVTTPKVDHKNTKCYICGSKDTHIKPDGEPFWIRHKNNGIWDHKNYECYKCHYNIGKNYKPRTPERFFEGRICCICGKDKSYQNHWYRLYNEKGEWNKKSYTCLECYDRYSPNSSHGQIKLMANSRNSQLNIDSPSGKGLIGEAIAAKVRGLKILTLESNNFRNDVDLSLDSEYRKIEVKVAVLGNNSWQFNTIRWQVYDNLLLVCIDRERKNVKRTYIIPSEDTCSISSITIYAHAELSKWEKYRIDERSYNDAYHCLMEFLKDKKYFGIEDIKKWLEMSIK